VKFLIEECLRPVVAAGLAAAGHDAVHVGDVDLLGATDDEVMAFAVTEKRVVVSADTDFGELLAVGGASMPSVILLRRRHDPDDQAQAILGVLPDVSDDLIAGAVVVIVKDRLRVRRLSIR
jgi:predicted nuclease of predicted toxin-antitoxin system